METLCQKCSQPTRIAVQMTVGTRREWWCVWCMNKWMTDYRPRRGLRTRLYDPRLKEHDK